ncbi:MAG: RNA polymerase subunit sigma-24 [Candidatus Cloacimonetes bacterium]|nr:RNA polymerase subunit sigma-24 [Candidatus Cloacimonadota bacterium]
MGEDAAAARRAIEAVWRAESARIVAALTRHTGDFAWAEDLAQEALVEALAAWPVSGIPTTPGAWLLTVAKRRAVDGWRRRERMSAREPLLAHDVRLAEDVDTVPELADPDDIADDILRLVFVCCHPVLPAPARLALTLRTVVGLTTEAIARVLLMSVPAVQQRIVRAKRTLAESGVPFEVPDRAQRPERLGAVLQVVYLLFTEGYASADGAAAIRPDVAREAVRLARVTAALMPGEAEIHGLIALMEFQSSRFSARVDAQGRPVLLADQDRSRWDRSAIRRGTEALARAESERGYGYYGLQAAIAQCHAVAARPDETDWDRVVALYDALLTLAPTAVVRLNRAVAVAHQRDPATALVLVDELAGELSGFRPWFAVRAELLERMGRQDAAAAAFDDAAALPGNAAETAVLRGRADALRSA